jgi:hypothetical protein
VLNDTLKVAICDVDHLSVINACVAQLSKVLLLVLALQDLQRALTFMQNCLV